MIILKATSEDLAAASQLSRQVDLINVYLTDVRAWNDFNKLSDRTKPIKVKYSEPKSESEITDINTLIVKSSININGIIDDTEEEITPELEKELMVLQIKVEFAAEFDLPEGEMPQDIRKLSLPAFTKLNGPYVCMPYLRQAINNIAGQMQIVLPPLPTLKIQPEDEQSLKTRKSKS